ncbi:YdiK family protein [Bacillus pinisoli]|uniref:YdiK family protein n=1 Tax=Bacillus pinisoli TaxID=2901866 RepID=UPI001FF47F97|nr:YdiK family protein [Bacillus pinisoli]
MRTSPFLMGILYFGMGVIFIVLAIQSKTEDIWSFPTIILMLVATFDFGVSIRMFSLHKRIKQVKK